MRNSNWRTLPVLLATLALLCAGAMQTRATTVGGCEVLHHAAMADLRIGDDLIERPVFVALMTAIGFDLPNINALFDAFEPDVHDRVAVPVWVEAIKEYYAPDKAGTVGNHLVGNTT